MTMTKVLYVVAAVVPFGCIILACVGIFHVVMVAKRERKQRQQAQLATCQFGLESATPHYLMAGALGGHPVCPAWPWMAGPRRTMERELSDCAGVKFRAWLSGFH